MHHGLGGPEQGSRIRVQGPRARLGALLLQPVLAGGAHLGVLVGDQSLTACHQGHLFACTHAGRAACSPSAKRRSIVDQLKSPHHQTAVTRQPCVSEPQEGCACDGGVAAVGVSVLPLVCPIISNILGPVKPSLMLPLPKPCALLAVQDQFSICMQKRHLSLSWRWWTRPTDRPPCSLPHRFPLH